MTTATPRWDDLGPNWTARVAPITADKPVSLLSLILTADAVWRNLTKPQRELLLSAVAGYPIAARADVKARLVKRGLIHDDLTPTEAARLVFKWRSP